MKLSPRRAECGFTLIELLVVIAIIAILASFLYTDDSNDYLIPSTFKGASMTGGGFWGGPTPDITAGISVDQAMQRVRKGLTNGPLFKYIANHTSYHCPGDLRTRRLKPGRGWAYDSYSKSEGINGFTGWSTVVPFQKASAVRDPSTTMVFVEETDPRGFNIGTWALWTSPPRWVDVLAIFHGNWSTFSFTDGHAEGHRWNDPLLIRAAKEAGETGKNTLDFPGAGPNNRDFRWVWDRF